MVLRPGYSLGVDCYYHYQNVTNPEAVLNSGYTFAYTKGCDGRSGVVDPVSARTYARNLRSAGLKVGFYHFAQPGVSSPEEQADRFYSAVLQEPHDLVPALDMEQDVGPSYPYTTWCNRFIDEYRRLSGLRQMLVYTSRYWFTSNRVNADGFDNDVWFWPAAYTSYQPDINALGWAHDRIAIYQYSDRGHVPGIVASGVDLDLAIVDLSTISYGGSPAPEEDFLATMSDDEKALLLEAAQSVLFGLDGVRNVGPLASAVDAIGHILTDPITSGVPDSTATFSPRDAWRNADAYGYEIAHELTTNPSSPASPVDVAALAQQLSSSLGPQLGGQLLTALREQLNK